MIVNTIVMAILIGDTVNDLANRVTTFETIGSKSKSDVFTTVKNPAGASIGLKDLRDLCDSVKNPNAKEKILVISTALLSQVSEFKYSGTGSILYRSTEEVAKMLGVNEVIECDLMDADGTEGGVYAICFLPDGYWYNEKNAIKVAYPKYETNTMNYQKERNIGGAIHDLYSSAVLKAAASENQGGGE